MEERYIHVIPEQFLSSYKSALNFLLGDDAIEEIMYNGPSEPVRIIHSEYHSCKTNLHINARDAHEFVIAVAVENHKVLSEGSPTMDGVLSDGSRINITLPPVTRSITFTVRKQHAQLITPFEFLRNNSVSPECMAFLWNCIDGLQTSGANILVVGGTASGKTTLMNALTFFIPEDERILTIEDTSEIRLLHQNRVNLFASEQKKISMQQLLINSLRMRPDRIIVGEVRGAEAETLFTAMNTGHKGCMGTLHAQSAREAVTRIKNNPMNVSPSLLRGLDLIIVMEKQGNTRIIKEITEIEVNATETVVFNQIYTYDPKQKKTVPTNIPSQLQSRIMAQAGIAFNQFQNAVIARSSFTEILKSRPLSSIEAFRLIQKNKEQWKTFKPKRILGMLIKPKEKDVISW